MREFNNILQVRKRVGFQAIKINTVTLLVLGVLYMKTLPTFSRQSCFRTKPHNGRDNSYIG